MDLGFRGQDGPDWLVLNHTHRTYVNTPIRLPFSYSFLLSPLCSGQHGVQDRGELEQAEQHCRRLLDVGDQSKEHAKTLLAELHALRAAEQSDDMAVDSDSDPQSQGSPPRARALWG